MKITKLSELSSNDFTNLANFLI